MSRGGRGWGKNSNLLTGATWEQDPNVKVETKPSELFPPVPDLPAARRLTRAERRIIQNTKALRKAIHLGPLYTESQKQDPFQSKRIYGEEQRNAQYGANSRTKAEIDPFEAGVPTYSLRFSRLKRTIPQLSGRPFHKDLFPPELHDTLEGKTGAKSTTARKAGSKKLTLAMTPAQQAAVDLRRKQVLDNLQKLGEDDEDDEKANNKGDEEEGNGEEEDQDDNFEDDEYEMEGDYDAEQYFDGGENEDDEGDGGGGDDY